MEQIVKITLEEDNGKITLSTETPNEYPHRNIKNNISLINVPITNNYKTNSNIIYFTNPKHESTNLMLLEETTYQLTFESKKKFDYNDIFYNLKYDDFETIPFSENKLPKNNNSTFYTGTLNFKGFVGKTFINIKNNEKIIYKIPIEVRSKKIDYMEEYPAMIADLSKIASGLIYKSKSPLYQEFQLDITKNKTKYEDFMLLEYLFRSENLPSTFEYLSKNLYSNLEETVETVPTSLASNIGPNELVNMISSPKYLIKPKKNYNSNVHNKLKGYMPSSINEINYQDNIDTLENKFFKYFLEMVNYIIDECLKMVDEGYVKEKLLNFHDEINYYLSQKFFKDISKMDYAPLNSQVLQKKEGYRDIFEYFLMLEFSFKLNWNELSNDFKGYEKKLSELYEYWCYFKLIKILKELTNTKINFEDIYEINEDKWSIKLHENRKSKLKFVYKNIKLELLYIKKFNQKSIDKSYSLPFKPDFTIIFINNDKQYLIHFDAKYRINGNLFKEDENIYKNPDIYKMHTYKDALKNTIGAYIFYPGTIKQIFKESYNIVPSVGAFPLNPKCSKDNEKEISKFLIEIFNEISK